MPATGFGIPSGGEDGGLEGFFEGFDDSYAMWHLTPVGLVTPEPFGDPRRPLEQIARQSPACGKVAFGDSSVRWRDPDVETITCKGGAILALPDVAKDLARLDSSSFRFAPRLHAGLRVPGTHRTLALSATIHRGGEIQVVAFPQAFLRALETKLERNVRWDVSRSDGHLFVTAGGESFDTEVRAEPLLGGSSERDAPA